MICNIVTDKERLALKSTEVDLDLLTPDFCVIRDLLETAEHYRLHGKVGCAGLAANQISYLDRIVVVWRTTHWVVMVNPVIEILKGKWGLSHEGCLSRPGVNVKVKRAKRIKVSYYDANSKINNIKLTGFLARVAQHEVDHLNGVFI